MNDIYKNITPINRAGSEPLNELKISVRYDKGGINYFTGQSERRGIYVHFKPVHRGGMFETTTLLGSNKESGFKVFVRDLGRKSQKQMDDIALRMEPLADDIAKKWDTEDWKGIYQMVMEAV